MMFLAIEFEEMQVIFDGQCGLCSESIKFIAKRDRNDKFTFISNISVSGNDLLHNHGLKAISQQSIILIQDNQCYLKSIAIQKILVQLPGWKTVGYLLYLVPKFATNWIYTLIAKNRKRLSGNVKCKISDKKLVKKFVY